MTAATRMAIDWVEQGLVSDSVVRQGIRRLLARRLREIGAADRESAAAAEEAVILQMDRSPIALVPELVNAQHY
ncbi:MAG: hypothetical protein ACUVQI_02495 [Thermochromatium sp.]